MTILTDVTNKQRMAQVIALGNQKGGVGKTSTTVHLAAALGELGYRVLIWDLDSNAGATKSFGIPPEFRGSCDVLAGDETPAAVILKRDPVEVPELPQNVDLIAARRDLEELDARLRQKNKFIDPSQVLLKPISELRPFYDFILLDTSPNINTPTVGAYKGADWFMLVAFPEPLAIRGLNDAIEDIATVKNAGNPNLRLLGVLLCNVERGRRVSSLMIEFAKDGMEAAGEFGVFETMISRATAVAKAQAQGKTMLETDPTHKVTDQYRALAREVLGRLEKANSAKVNVTPETRHA